MELKEQIALAITLEDNPVICADDILKIPDIKEALSLLELKRQGKLYTRENGNQTKYFDHNGKERLSGTKYHWKKVESL